jgi:two-component system nitrate/nitrite response regulator NarP
MLAGAAGSSGATAPVERLPDTCLAVAGGQMVFPFLDVRELQADPISQLTRRERALLEALSRGLTNKDLARDFDISANTVKFHLSNLFEKLGVANRAQAIAFYYSSRLPEGGRAGLIHFAEDVPDSVAWCEIFFLDRWHKFFLLF